MRHLSGATTGVMAEEGEGTLEEASRTDSEVQGEVEGQIEEIVRRATSANADDESRALKTGQLPLYHRH